MIKYSEFINEEMEFKSLDAFSLYSRICSPEEVDYYNIIKQDSDLFMQELKLEANKLNIKLSEEDCKEIYTYFLIKN
jgi:hypothetical protein